VASLRRATTLPLDVHLMIENPDRYIEAFAEAGANIITVHAEAATHLHRTLTRIRQLKVRAGVAINPATPVESLRDVVDHIDVLLVMSVNPGFGGQTFIEHSFRKLQSARALLTEAGNPGDVEVDGGVDEHNAARLVSAGASMLVAGVSIFGKSDPGAATRALRQAAQGSR
jgi:ribulose-phosphate 3-epimerase